MLDSSAIAAGFRQLAPDQFQNVLALFLSQETTAAEKIAAIETILRGQASQTLRNQMAQWIVSVVVPVESLVPKEYIKWRPPVRDAMMFVVAHLSPSRLAPKLLEQIELPPRTTAEVRLLRLIAKVPGLQKLGQVIARNQHLRPGLRKALERLENGIREVKPDDIGAIVQQNLGVKLTTFAVKLAPTILKEASVSAVVRFTWRNPDTGRRERGVFKVLKPHIPKYFAEDLDYLQGLAQYFATRDHIYGFPARFIPDTFRKVRRLLRHEVNFTREQKTLLEASPLYRSVPGARVPRIIQVLSTPTITAMTEERGVKVTTAAARLPETRRRQLAEKLVETLIAVPLFSAAPDAVFHGDPHAGNLLYDNRTGELTIVDWALREHLNREQRRHLALLFLMVGFRNPVGVFNELGALSQHRIRMTSSRGKVVREVVDRFLAELPSIRLPSGADAMRLLERVAMSGIKFPASLIMLAKVMFTLEGVLEDVAGADTTLGVTFARRLVQHWLANRSAFRSPLMTRDWIALQCSALLYPSRVWMQWEQTMLDSWLKPKSAASSEISEAET